MSSTDQSSSSQKQTSSSSESPPPVSDDALTAAIKAVSQPLPSHPSAVPIDPSSTSTSRSSAFLQFFTNPFSVTWRAALVKAPRLVPMSVLKYTCPEGPWPFQFDLKSPRGKHKIPLYIWVPEPEFLPNVDKQKSSDGESGKSTPTGGPYGASPPSSGFPIVIDFHGGGFVLGSCLEQGPFAAMMCRQLGAVVMSVDYRMGPIDKFPAAIWDGEDVLGAVLQGDSEAGRELRDAVAKRIKEIWKEKSRRHKHGEAKESKEKKKEKKRNENDNKHGLQPPMHPSATTSTISIASIATSSVFDTSRLAISGFSSGGNLALNLAISIQPPTLSQAWPSVIPTSFPGSSIPLLLFYPSLDSRVLPSQRTRPANLPVSSPFWTEVDDILMPSYLPRSQASHPRASPGLAPVRDAGLHPHAKPLLVLPELDTLAEQSELWVKKVADEGRGQDLAVLKYEGMKHGWTQFPVTWLGEREREARDDAFTKTVEFVKRCWEF